VNIYLDASVIVKRYIVEDHSHEVNSLLTDTHMVATSLLSRVEVPAAIAKSVRVGSLRSDIAVSAVQSFRSHWDYFVSIAATETLLAFADTLAWDHGLRGYDAVHLASALTFIESSDETSIFATFDRQLWTAAAKAGLDVWPARLKAH
jgi:predicted nucleic acid-binding protein